MYKTSFRYLGQTGYLLLLGLIIIAFIGGLLINYQEMQPREKSFMIYGGSFLLVVVVLIWHRILTEINEIEITESTIKIKNLLTKRTRQIEKVNLEGYRESFNSGYKILLVDRNNKVCGEIKELYYKDFKSLIDNLGLKYLAD